MGVSRASSLLVALAAGLVTGVAFGLLLAIKERNETREIVRQALASEQDRMRGSDDH